MKTNVSQDEEDTEKEKRGEPQDGDWNCYCEQSDQRSFHRHFVKGLEKSWRRRFTSVVRLTSWRKRFTSWRKLVTSGSEVTAPRRETIGS
jgi:hypothetical protein